MTTDPETLRRAVLDLYERVERLEMRADGLTPMERVSRRWEKEKAADGDKLDRLIAQDAADDDGPAVAEGTDTPATGGWQPIETAPKDGTEILASDYDAVEIVAWRLSVWRGDPGCWIKRSVESMFPSWWQPLPDHPPLPGEPTNG